MRSFVQLDDDGNAVATLESPYPPGSDRAVVPDNFIEVTDLDPQDWLVMRWTGSAFEARTDLGG
tara:strand:- start:56 stop:247 length:192 start_codon:yes stop_codon:yes gene_type:complete